ncbi:hypothetical protein T484DRAFT_1914671, partial [Baffinella frigidus]
STTITTIITITITISTNITTTITITITITITLGCRVAGGRRSSRGGGSQSSPRIRRCGDTRYVRG